MAVVGATVNDDTQIIVWKVTVNVNVDDSELQSWIKNERKIEDLREQYNRAKRRLRKQMNDADRDFLANQKLKKGNKQQWASKNSLQRLTISKSMQKNSPMFRIERRG